MTENTAQRLEKLEQLEEMIARTVERFTELTGDFDELKKENETLQGQINELQAQNAELTSQIDDLKASQAEVSELAIGDQKVLSKIDRMLEKFGELQI